MPTKPNGKIKGDSVDLLNAIRNENGSSYSDVIPPAIRAGMTNSDGSKVTSTQALERLRTIGQALLTYEPAMNAFISTLVNRIGRVMISSRLYENPWAAFKRGYLEYGETIEEIFVNLMNAHQYDPEEAQYTVFKREKPDVRAVYHTLNYQKFYKVTTNEAMLRQAFLSFEGVNDLITKIIEQLYTSANFDEFLMMKYTILTNAMNGRMYPQEIDALPSPPTSTATNAIVVQLKNLSEQLTFMNDKYNFAGVATYSDKEYQYFILNSEFLAAIDVETLARAFNLDKVTLMGHTVVVNTFSFTPLEEKRVLNLLYPDEATRPNALFTDAQKALIATIPGVVVDQNWFMIFDNLQEMRTQPNNEGLEWQHWLHVWKTFSTSPFTTAIVLTTSKNAVTAVTVNPATATINKGAQLQLTATVATTGFASQDVTWSINSTLSTISPQGLLIVSPNETASSITVTATSNYDSTKTGTATITVGTNGGTSLDPTSES